MEQIRELRVQVLASVRTMDPSTMSGAQAARAVQELSIIEKAAATGRMFAAVRVAKTDAWRGQGHASAADWLAAQAGITVREAAAQLGTARKAERLPKTKDEMRKGNLSPGQAGSVTDAATADPSAEDDLLASARNDTASKLKEKAAKAKAAATDSATRERRIRAERSVRTHTDADGAFCLSLRGPAADGVRLKAKLRQFEEEAFRVARTARHDGGERDTFENRSYDAFFNLIDAFDETGDASTADGEPMHHPGASPTHGSSTRGCQPDGSGGGGVARPTQAAAPAARRRPAGGNNLKVIVRIDHTALARGRTIAGETCDVPGLGPISVAAAKVLMEDAFVAAVITKGTDVVTVAHLGRGLNAHQRTAIEWTGLACSNPACNHTVALQIDHRVPFARDPVTKLDNQDPLCPDCHRRKTHHGWHLEPGSGPRRFLPPDQHDRGASSSSTPGPSSEARRQPALL